jgi:hypothetical protein
MSWELDLWGKVRRSRGAGRAEAMGAELQVEGASAGRVRANLWLLGLNFGLLAVASFLPAGWRDTAERALLTGIFLATLAVHGTRIRWRLAVVAGLIAVQWGAKLAGGHELALVAGVLNGVFFLYVISRLAVLVAGARDVTRLVLLEAVNVYLLVGLVFSLLAAVVAGAWPGPTRRGHGGGPGAGHGFPCVRLLRLHHDGNGGLRRHRAGAGAGAGAGGADGGDGAAVHGAGDRGAGGQVRRRPAPGVGKRGGAYAELLADDPPRRATPQNGQSLH